MRRIRWIAAAIVLCLVVALSGCGKKDAGSVVKDLDQTISKLDSYKGSGKMVLMTGQQPQEYQVEVWYQNPNFYRIALKNDKQSVNQIVLRNNDGVYVLTPALNKSFRFQSEWPQRQGQYYLYQSLVDSILEDKDRKFTVDGNDLVFDVAANYAHTTLSRQKIWLDKKSYKPKHIEVRDTNDNTLVTMDFTSFEFGEKFADGAFDTNRNLAGTTDKADPTLGDLESIIGDVDGAGAVKDLDAAVDDKAAATESTETNAAKTDDQAKDADPKDAAKDPKVAAESGQVDGEAVAVEQDDSSTTGLEEGTSAVGDPGFAVIQPSIQLEGVVQQDINDIMLGEDKAVMIRYKGAYNFSLVESAPKAQEVMLLPGASVDLGFTIGTLTGNEKRTLTWTYNGKLFRISSADLPTSQMVTIAQSLQGDTEK
ncbi:MAG: outer membrane lipoprotein carrier protein LolA [Paenibacillus sp.]|nr:outer membrane lipoprotein carrier protein LolA [Paenibacillus sp.]